MTNETEPRPQGRAGSGKRRAFEAVGLLAAVVAAEAAFGRIGSPDLHPHPYWIAVLPTAIRHGRRTALFAAASASLVHVGAAIGAGVVPAAAAEAALFIAVALVVGGLRDRLRASESHVADAPVTAIAAAAEAVDTPAPATAEPVVNVDAEADEEHSDAGRRAPGPAATEFGWREVGTPEELGERLRREYERGARHGVPVGVVVLHFFLWNDESDGARERLDSHVVRHFAGSVRASDAVYDFGLRGCYVAVLPHTSESAAAIVRQRLEQRALHSPVREIGPVKIDVTPTDLSAPDVESLLTSLEAHFRFQSILPLGAGGPPMPPARVPVRGLKEFVLALRTEVNLAGREASSLSVVAVFAPHANDAPPGLLAEHVEDVAPRTLRACDQAFAVGPNHIALVLPRTRPGDAAAVGHRLSQALAERHADAPYGQLAERVLEFDRAHPTPKAFLGTLGNLAPISDVVESSGS